MSVFPAEGAWIQVTKKIPISNPPEPLSVHWAVFEKAYIERPDMHFVDMPYGWKKHFAGGSADDVVRMFCLYMHGKTESMSEEQLKAMRHLEGNNFDIYLASKVKVLTPDGDIFLLDHEFTIVEVEKYMECVDGEHACLHFFGDSGEFDFSQKIKDAIFYLRSRGVSFTEAIKMMAGQINQPGVFWLTFHEEYQKMFVRNFKERRA